MSSDNIPGNIFYRYAFYLGQTAAHIFVEQRRTYPERLKQRSTSVTAYRRNAHFGKYLEHSLIDCRDIMFLGSRIIKLYCLVLYKFIQYGKCHIRIHAACTISDKQGHVHHLAHFTGLYDNRGLSSLAAMDKMMMHCGQCQ